MTYTYLCTLHDVKHARSAVRSSSSILRKSTARCAVLGMAALVILVCFDKAFPAHTYLSSNIAVHILWYLPSGHYSINCLCVSVGVCWMNSHLRSCLSFIQGYNNSKLSCHINAIYFRVGTKNWLGLKRIQYICSFIDWQNTMALSPQHLQVQLWHVNPEVSLSWSKCSTKYVQSFTSNY